MKIIENLDISIKNKTAVTLGNFDGFHIGHRRLVDKIKATGLETVIFTFSPHPVRFFAPDKKFKTIYTEEEKKLTAGTLGADLYINCPFTEAFSRLSPEEFIRLLKETTNCAYLAIGENYSFGKNKAGNAETLRKIGANYGIEAAVLKNVSYDGTRVSSTHIRALIKDGLMEQANTLLGAPYFITGRVVHGKQRGGDMGFPTVNTEIASEKLLPGDGVYATTTYINSRPYPSVTNIGKNPTFHNTARTVETHITDYNGDLYGEKLKIDFRFKIRNEKTFSDKTELIEQIRTDIITALIS